MKLSERVAKQKTKIAELEAKLEHSHKLMAKWANLALDTILTECENDPVLLEDLRPHLLEIMEKIIAEKNSN